jgi:ferredoxin
MRRPEVDLGRCTLCMGCVELCPQVFRLSDAGFILVADLETFPEDAVDEAIKYCPEDAIMWDSGQVS